MAPKARYPRSATSLRLRLLTIGESPRDDIVSEMKRWWPTLETGRIEQLGVLDGMSDAQIEAMAPRGDEPRLVSRRRNGQEVILRKESVEHRLDTMTGTEDESESPRIDALLCTGRFVGARGGGIWLPAQKLVDQTTKMMAEGLTSLGLVIPLADQRQDFLYEGSIYEDTPQRRTCFAQASPYGLEENDIAWERVAEQLSGAELIVMHCMGYSESQREALASRTKAPVLLARRIVAANIAQLI